MGEVRILFIISFALFFSRGFGSAPDSTWLTGRGWLQEITFDASGSALSSIPNEMLQDISADRDKQLNATSFWLNWGVEINLRYSSPAVSLEIIFYRNGTGGDNGYRGFSLNGVLFPDSLTGEIRIGRKSDGIIYTGPFRFEPDTAKRTSIRIIAELPFFNPREDSIILEGFKPAYTKANLEAFRNRLSVVNDYYACSFVTDTLLAMSLDIGQPARVPVDRLFLFLEEVNKFLSLAEQKDPEINLDLASFDPINYRNLHRELSRYSRSATMTFAERLDTMASRPGSLREDELSDGLMKMLLRYIRWSNLLKERNSAVYRDFLNSFWIRGAFEQDSVIINKMISAYYPEVDRDSLLGEISGKLSQAYRVHARALAAEGMNAEALGLLNNRQIFASHNPWLKSDPADDAERLTSLDGIYHSYLGVAVNALTNGKPDLAETYLKTAEEFRLANRLDPDPELDSLIAVTSPSYLSDRILSAESLIWTNRLKEAEAFVDSIERLRGNRELYGDSVLNRAIQRYHVLITQKACWNADENIEILKVRAERAAELENYPRVCMLLDSALTLTQSHPECGFFSGGISDSLEKYSPACEYAGMIREAQDRISMNDFDAAVRTYDNAGSFFLDHKIADFGLYPVDLKEIVRQKGLPNFTLSAVSYYKEMKQFPLSLEFMKIVRLQDLSGKRSRPAQADLAKKLASADHSRDPGQDPAANAKAYAGDDKWFSSFRSAYVAEWKRLDKSGK